MRAGTGTSTAFAVIVMEYREINGLQVLTFRGDFRIDDLASYNVNTIDRIYDWLESNVTEGRKLPVMMLPGCSVFTTVCGDSGYICRNFDFVREYSVAMLVAVVPDSGYRFAGMVPKALISTNLSDGRDEILSDPRYRAAQYVLFDGMNEKGVVCALLDVNGRSGRTVPDGRDIITSGTAIELVLNRCSTVDEALDLLDTYNVSPNYLGGCIHIFVADAFGNAATYETVYDEGSDTVEHHRTYTKVLTNHFRYDMDVEKVMATDDEELNWTNYRFKRITNAISGHPDRSGCLAILKDISCLNSRRRIQSEVTAWSLIFDPREGTVSVWTAQNFDDMRAMVRLDDVF